MSIRDALAPGGALHALAAYPHFCVYELRPRMDKPGTDKVPVLPVKWGTVANLLTAEQALQAAEAWKGELPVGVGYLLQESDPFFFLDMDKAIEGKEWKPHVADLCRTLKGAAFEVSSSRKGCHLFGSYEGELAHAKKYAPLGLELYTSGRLAALTGESARGDAAKVLTAELEGVIAQYFEPKVGAEVEVEWGDIAAPDWKGPEDDDELLEKMLSSNRAVAAVVFGGAAKASFRDLWEGDAEALAAAYPAFGDGPYDGSAADLALASKLAFWTGRNPVRILRLMERSALVREKWESRPAYLAGTIEKAIGGCQNVYGSPREVAVLSEEALEGAWLPADPMYHGTMTAEQITARMLSEDDKSGKLSAARSSGDVGYVAWAALNNSGLSCELALEVCKSLLDTEEVVLRSAIVAKREQMSEYRGKPVEWDRAPDLSDVSRVSFAELSVDPVERNMNDHFTDANTLLIHAFSNRLGSFSHVAYWWEGRHWELVADQVLRRHVGSGLNNGGETKLSNSRITGTAAVIKDQMPMRRVLNPRSHLVFFQNCVVDAATGKTSGHAPGYDNSYLLNCDYEPDAQCPAWIAWLEDIFESDPERIQLMQEQFGWALITDNLGLHKAVVWVGVPRGGKGTALSILSRLCGDAAGAFQLSGLADDKVLSGFAAKNIVIDSDAASVDRTKAREVAGKFKTLTANEPVSVKLLYTQTPFQGELNCKMYLAANSVPNLYDDSGATANRWVPLVFDKSFLGREDTGLAERLEAEMTGIAMWALEGLRRLIERRRFTMPRSSLEELESLVESASPLVRFIDEMCVAGEGLRVSDPEIWELYTKWALGHGFEPLPKKAFTEGFRQAARGMGARWSKSVMIDGKQCRGFYGIGPSGKLPPTSNVVQMR